MNTDELLKDALDFLAPLYGLPDLMLDDLRKTSHAPSAELRTCLDTLENTCNKIELAGDIVSGFLTCRYKNRALDYTQDTTLNIKDELRKAFVDIGTAYGKYAYHAARCGCRRAYPDDDPIMMLADGVCIKRNKLTDAAGYLLNKHYRTTKLGAFARMEDFEAQLLLQQTAQREISEWPNNPDW